MDNDEVSRHAGEEHHGWSPDVGTGGSDRAKEANKKAFGDPPAGEGQGKDESEEERQGVPPTDPDAETPLGVGTSSTTRAEEYGEEGEEGHRKLGTKGESERPYGDRDPDEDAGVAPSKPIDPESPYLPPA
jgi:hypothetical protein